MLDLNIRVIFEQFSASRNIVLIVVDPQNSGLFKVVNDGRKGASGGSSDV